MPLTLGDVLDTLSDPVALGIELYVDKIHVKGEYLTTVRDRIRAGDSTRDALLLWFHFARLNPSSSVMPAGVRGFVNLNSSSVIDVKGLRTTTG